MVSDLYRLNTRTKVPATMRWSQLRVQIEALFDPALKLQLHCTAQRGEDGASIGRYWFVLNKENIWDEPQRISRMLVEGSPNSDASIMGAIIREYLGLSREALLEYLHPDDRWGLVEVLQAADRRIGKRRLPAMKSRFSCRAALRILEQRLCEHDFYPD